MANEQNNQQLIGYSKIIMINTGFWKYPISDHKIIQLCFKVYSVLIKFVYIIFFILLVAELIRMSLGDYPYQVKFNALGIIITSGKNIVKILIFLRYDIMEMFNDVIEKEKEVWKSSEEIQNVYRVKIQVCKKYVLILVGATGATGIIYQITGAYGMIQVKHQNLICNETIEASSMYLTIFPRDRLSNLYITFSVQSLWMWVGTNFHIIIHLVFLTLLTYSTSQLEILQVKLKNFIGPDFTADDTDAKLSLLKSIIDEHKHIIGFVEHLNKCTKYVIQMEYMVSSVELASIVLNLIRPDISLSEIGWRLTLLIVVTGQIFILAWSCNEVKVQSEAVSDALYDSRWYLLNKEGKQLVQIMIARAQKPLMMTIGNFGPMTNDSAVVIVKAAYSYVSIVN